jgi:hypothetical protein
MSQENAPAPNAPKESIFKNSPLGLLSIAIFILWLIFTPFLVWAAHLNRLGSLLYVFFPRWFASPIIVIISAVAGLLVDKKKQIAKAVLVLSLLTLLGCLAIQLYMIFTY